MSPPEGKTGVPREPGHLPFLTQLGHGALVKSYVVLIVAGAIIASQKSIASSAEEINLMQAARLDTEHFLSLTVKVLKMQIYQPGIVRISCEVVRGLRRFSA
jgi:hypothetical protein